MDGILIAEMLEALFYDVHGQSSETYRGDEEQEPDDD